MAPPNKVQPSSPGAGKTNDLTPPPDDGAPAKAPVADATEQKDKSNPEVIKVSPEKKTQKPPKKTSKSSREKKDVPEPADEPTGGRSFFNRLSFTIGYGYSALQSAVGETRDPFAAAAPTYRGHSFFFQPGVSIYRNRYLDFKGILDLNVRALGLAPDPGNPESSITGLSIAVGPEFSVFPHRHFAIGASAVFGYLGFISSNAEFGGPFNATYDFGEQGGPYLGLRPHLGFWDNNIRIHFGLDLLLTDFDLPSGTGTSHRIGYGPAGYLGLGVDVLGIIQSATGGNDQFYQDTSGTE